MGNVNTWTVELTFTEDGEATRADAVMAMGDRRRHSWGRARRSPADPDVPVVGEELAAARALTDLAHQLIHAAVEEIEAFEGRPVAVHH